MSRIYPKLEIPSRPGTQQIKWHRPAASAQEEREEGRWVEGEILGQKELLTVQVSNYETFALVSGKAQTSQKCLRGAGLL